MSNPAEGDILSLLAHVVIADSVVRMEEVDAFITAAQQLGLRGKNGRQRSRKWLLTWFKAELPRIKTEAKDHHIHNVWSEGLVRLSQHEDRRHILKQMCEISYAKGRPHTNEQLLVALASGHWDVRSPAWFDATG